MALSAAFLRWMWGGTNWYFIYFFFNAVFNKVDASLSSMWMLGVKPAEERVSMIDNVALQISAACLVFRGLTRIALIS